MKNEKRRMKNEGTPRKARCVKTVLENDPVPAAKPLRRGAEGRIAARNPATIIPHSALH